MSKAIKTILEEKHLLLEITQRAFDKIDKNKNGKIEIKELEPIMKQIALDFRTEAPSEEELAKVMEQLDTDKSGTIELKEFQILIRDLLKAMLEQDK